MKKLFYAGTILTMDEPLYAEAVITEDDKIIAVGNEEKLRNSVGKEKTEEVNLNGAVMIPGFIDPHSHFFQVALSYLQISLNGVKSAGEMAERTAAYIKENNIPRGQWLNARDYDNNLMPEIKNPTIDELDRIAPDNPIIIHHKSGHMGLMNTLAMKEFGITPETTSPEGGRIEKENGKLTGYFEENAYFEYLKKMPVAEPANLLDVFEKAQQKYASYGITTVQEGMVAKEMLPLYRLLSEKKLLKLDVNLYCDTSVYDTALELFGKASGDNHINVAGVKIFLDGSPQGRTAWMRKPYEGEKDYCAYGTMSDSDVEKAFCFAAERSTQLIGHCNGDAAAEQFLRCLEKAEEKYPQLKKLRPVIIHGQLIGRDQLNRVSRLGAMISFFIAHVFHWGDVHLRNFGKERGSHISPAMSALKEGVKFTFHQDAPVIDPDMTETLWCAVTRETGSGVKLAREECISPYEALKAVTVNSAYQYFKENEIGCIAQGRKADFAVLDKNPLTVPEEDIRNIRVLKTYKNGEIIFSRP